MTYISFRKQAQHYILWGKDEYGFITLSLRSLDETRLLRLR